MPWRCAKLGTPKIAMVLWASLKPRGKTQTKNANTSGVRPPNVLGVSFRTWSCRGKTGSCQVRAHANPPATFEEVADRIFVFINCSYLPHPSIHVCLCWSSPRSICGVSKVPPPPRHPLSKVLHWCKLVSGEQVKKPQKGSKKNGASKARPFPEEESRLLPAFANKNWGKASQTLWRSPTCA